MCSEKPTSPFSLVPLKNGSSLRKYAVIKCGVRLHRRADKLEASVIVSMPADLVCQTIIKVTSSLLLTLDFKVVICGN